MTNKEIYDRLIAVCEALDKMTVTGVRNAGSIAGSYSILSEICTALQNENNTTSNDSSAQDETSGD